MQKEALGEKHPDMVSTFENLATLYANQGLAEKAEEMYKKTVNLYKNSGFSSLTLTL